MVNGEKLRTLQLPGHNSKSFSWQFIFLQTFVFYGIVVVSLTFTFSAMGSKEV